MIGTALAAGTFAAPSEGSSAVSALPQVAAVTQAPTAPSTTGSAQANSGTPGASTLGSVTQSAAQASGTAAGVAAGAVAAASTATSPVVQPVQQQVVQPVRQVAQPIAQQVVQPVRQVAQPIAQQVVQPVRQVAQPIAQQVVQPVRQVAQPIAQQVVQPVLQVAASLDPALQAAVPPSAADHASMAQQALASVGSPPRNPTRADLIPAGRSAVTMDGRRSTGAGFTRSGAADPALPGVDTPSSNLQAQPLEISGVEPIGVSNAPRRYGARLVQLGRSRVLGAALSVTTVPMVVPGLPLIALLSDTSDLASHSAAFAVAQLAKSEVSTLPALLSPPWSALGASGASGFGFQLQVFAALLFALLVAAPRLGRRLRPDVDLWRPPFCIFSLERPG